MPTPELATIGQVKRQRREILGLTQEYLAEVSGVGLSKFSNDIQARNQS